MRPKSKLHSYQDDTIDAMFSYDRLQAILPMGAGKTASALTAYQELRQEGVVRHMLVLAPKRVAQLVWTREPEEWEHLAGMTHSLGLGTAAKRRKMLLWDEVDYAIQTIDNLQWLVKELQELPDDHPLFDLLVVDESSRLKSPRSKRGQALFKIIDRFKIVWFLTGTPRPNGLQDQFMPMKLLSGGKLWGRSWDVWERQNTIADDYEGHRRIIIPERVKSFEDDVAKYTYAINPDDMPYLPDPVVTQHWTSVPEQTQEKYSEMERDMLTELDELGEEAFAVNAGVKTAKLEQLLQGFMYRNPIMRALDPSDTTHERFDCEKMGMIEDLVDGAGGNVLLTYWYKAELELIKQRYPKIPVIGSGVSDRNVSSYERRWNDGELPILALHPASAGHGLNLQQGGSQMVMSMPIWPAELYDQVTKRIHRQGQKKRVYIHLVCSKPEGVNVDQMKIDRVVGKMTAQAAFIKAMRERV